MLLWEVASHARTPYGALNPAEIAADLKRGARLPEVEGCPGELRDLMHR